MRVYAYPRGDGTLGQNFRILSPYAVISLLTIVFVCSSNLDANIE